VGRPAVSLVVTCHNYGRFLGQALDSLLGQTLRELELIVIDDASGDSTPEVVASYARDRRVMAVRHPVRLGNIASYNEGLALASGRHVGVFSADDYALTPDALAMQLAAFRSAPGVGLVYSAHRIVQDGEWVRDVTPWPADGVHDGLVEFERLLWGNYVLHSGALLTAELAAELGPYEPALTHTGDWDMWLRASARSRVGYVSRPLYAYRLHGSNLFKTLPPAGQAEQVAATLERAYAALAPEEARRLGRLRREAARHARLQTAWFDVHQGRPRRALAGLRHALGQSPEVALHGEIWRLAAWLALQLVVGRDRYRRIARRREQARGGVAP
jgi:glycosyl transferase family 2